MMSALGLRVVGDAAARSTNTARFVALQSLARIPRPRQRRLTEARDPSALRAL